MPHSIFTGRPKPGPGEPEFLQEDTDLAVALALEERDTCPSCGMLKDWCRDPDKARARWNVSEDFCWATYRLAQRKPKGDDPQERATLVVPAIKPGYEPDVFAGLDLSPDDYDDAS